MRYALRNHAEVAHLWAHQSQPSGHAGNMLFDDTRVYSYGRHFCIARILPGGIVARTTQKYSVSTSKHCHIVGAAVRHLVTVWCHDPDASAGANMRHAREAIRTALNASERKGTRHTTRAGHRADALRIGEHANAYLAALPADERIGVQPIDLSALEAVRAELLAADAAAERIRAEQMESHRAELVASLEEWRTGAVIVRSGLYALPPALRLSADGSEIQTSHGATIPASLAPELWQIIQTVRARGRSFAIADRQIGPYRGLAVFPSGAIKVGCHDIAYAELERMAAALGLLETAGA